jgi:hypothetical protein
VLGLQTSPFADAQTQRVDACQHHAPHRVANGAEERAHLACAQNDGQCARPLHAQKVEHLPVATEAVLEEEA